MFKLSSRGLRRIALVLGFLVLTVLSDSGARMNKHAALFLPQLGNVMALYGAAPVTIDRNARDFKLHDQFAWQESRKPKQDGDSVWRSVKSRLVRANHQTGSQRVEPASLKEDMVTNSQRQPTRRDRPKTQLLCFEATRITPTPFSIEMVVPNCFESA